MQDTDLPYTRAHAHTQAHKQSHGELAAFVLPYYYKLRETMKEGGSTKEIEHR